ncbi:restriction endonuclease subunit S [Psychrobacter alimentarius]|uniref:restriction endonuclease subunit S n=1 Tax=Psychrobacter alimentarius TaxID=261164 RepID=UPI0019194FBD|nr:restriction endonuclease subunit S [Psychrobacter alimentarius]
MSFEWTTLGSFINIQGGYAYKSKEFVSSGNNRVLKIKNIRFGNVDYTDTVFIAEELASSTSQYKTKPQDVLISMTGSGPNAPNSLVGRVARVWDNEPEAWINQRVGRLQLIQEKAISLDFIYYLLTEKKSQNFLVSNSSGSANQANINGKTIESLPCPNISFSQSKNISQILLSFDNKIQLNNQINQTLEAMAQAIFKSWFVDFDPVRAKRQVLDSGGSIEDAERAAMRVISSKTDKQLDEMETSQPDEFAKLQRKTSLFPSKLVDSELGEIPEGWEVSTIDKSYEVIMGQSPKGETYNENGNGTLFYQGRAEFGWRFPSPRLYTTDPKRMAKQGDVLMSVRAPVGDLNIALNNCCVGRGLCALRHRSNSTSYSYYQFKDIKRKLNIYNGEGTVFGSVNQKTLKSIEIIEPESKIIQAFTAVVVKIDKQIRSSTQQSQSLAELRDTLLPKLLSGELDVSWLGEIQDD